MSSDPRITLNRRNWNERTPVHAASDFYDVASFKAGRITLNALERATVGDVGGKSLLHLQCHFGLDTLSWSRLGACATGIDISDEAITLARQLGGDPCGRPCLFNERRGLIGTDDRKGRPYETIRSPPEMQPDR